VSPRATPQPAPRRGFTLAEVAVTIALVGLAMVFMLQGLSTAKVTAAHTRNMKLSKELALLTLGRIEAGLYEEELDDERIEGSYADDGYPDFSFQAVIGDENLPERYDDERSFFDNWSWEREQSEYDDDDEELEQPYEKIQIRVVSPPIRELPNEVVLERWVAWDQLHGGDDEDEDLR
jgi:prepilin-type N-terminal cleavage/methylation domain-containing protein